MFHADGLDRHSNLAVIKFTGQAWVILELEANCLLGTAWLKPCGAVINFSSDYIIFKKINNFSIPFEIYTQAHPCVQHVILDRPVTLLPSQIAWAQTNYKDLP